VPIQVIPLSLSFAPDTSELDLTILPPAPIRTVIKLCTTGREPHMLSITETTVRVIHVTSLNLDTFKFGEGFELVNDACA
jgi:hypothetical protein